MDVRISATGSGGAHVLLIGNDELTDVTHRALRGAGAIVRNLRDPSDAAIRTALGHRVDTVVVISKDDHISLRNALAPSRIFESVLRGRLLFWMRWSSGVGVRLARLMSSLGKSWSNAVAVCPRPEHAGSRVRFDGHYGTPGHRRQYYKCVPGNGDRSHRFTEILAREESWADACEACERGVHFDEGPHAARQYQFVARGVAGALKAVGAGSS